MPQEEGSLAAGRRLAGRGSRSVVPELLASHELAAEAMHGRQRAEKRQIRNVTKKANVKL